jgi:hypothetical protein
VPLYVCPVCHQRAHIVGQQLYCTNCGWNRDAGIAALRSSLRMTPIGIVFVAGFGLLCVKFFGMRHPQQLAIMIVPIAFGLAFSYFYTRSRLAKLQAVPVNGTQDISPAGGAASAVGGSQDSGWSGEATDSARSVAVANFPPNPQDEAVLSVPRPRRVRMSTRGVFSVIVTMLFVLGLDTGIAVHLFSVWARTKSFSGFHSGEWLTVLLAVAILLFPYGLSRAQRRECDLLENGEVAMARVIGQWTDKNGRSVRYEFTDLLGQGHDGSGFDYSGKLQEGMSVPVFYDRDKANRQIAYCSTLHKIVV